MGMQGFLRFSEFVKPGFKLSTDKVSNRLSVPKLILKISLPSSHTFSLSFVFAASERFNKTLNFVSELEKMIRLFDRKVLIRGQTLIQSVCRLSTQTAAARDKNFEDEWNNAKPFESIPAMSKVEAVRAFLPGGNSG